MESIFPKYGGGYSGSSKSDDFGGSLASGLVESPAPLCATPIISTQPVGGEYDGETPVDMFIESEGAESLMWFERGYTDDIIVDGNYDASETFFDFTQDGDYETNDVLETPSGELILVVFKERFVAADVQVLRGYAGTTAAPVANEDIVKIYRPMLAETSAELSVEPDEQKDYRCIASNECGETASDIATVTVA
jgi:hypothetical protein